MQLNFHETRRRWLWNSNTHWNSFVLAAKKCHLNTGTEWQIESIFCWLWSGGFYSFWVHLKKHKEIWLKKHDMACNISLDVYLWMLDVNIKCPFSASPHQAVWPGLVFYFELVRAGLICQIPFMDVFDFDEDQIPMVAHKLGTRHALNPSSVTRVSSYYYHSMAIICMNEILLVHSV